MVGRRARCRVIRQSAAVVATFGRPVILSMTDRPGDAGRAQTCRLRMGGPVRDPSGNARSSDPAWLALERGVACTGYYERLRRQRNGGAPPSPPMMTVRVADNNVRHDEPNDELPSPPAPLFGGRSSIRIGRGIPDPFLGAGISKSHGAAHSVGGASAPSITSSKVERHRFAINAPHSSQTCCKSRRHSLA
jgi:hypothetical protein